MPRTVRILRLDMDLDRRIRDKARALGLSINSYIELLLRMSETPWLFQKLIALTSAIATESEE